MCSSVEPTTFLGSSSSGPEGLRRAQLNSWMLSPCFFLGFVGGRARRSCDGRGFHDGSFLHGGSEPLRHAVWSFAILDASGDTFEFAAYGPLPLAQNRQGVFPAELYAVIQLLRCAETPLKIHSDCQAVVDGTSRGGEWCSFPPRARATCGENDGFESTTSET